MGINFACQSVLENKGAALRTHLNELGRMAGELGELPVSQPPPMLTERLRAGGDEVESIAAHVDQWLRRTEVGLPVRLNGAGPCSRVPKIPSSVATGSDRGWLQRSPNCGASGASPPAGALCLASAKVGQRDSRLKAWSQSDRLMKAVMPPRLMIS
jgi:hypothetical protein